MEKKMVVYYSNMPSLRTLEQCLGKEVEYCNYKLGIAVKGILGYEDNLKMFSIKGPSILYCLLDFTHVKLIDIAVNDTVTIQWEAI